MCHIHITAGEHGHGVGQLGLAELTAIHLHLAHAIRHTPYALPGKLANEEQQRRRPQRTLAKGSFDWRFLDGTGIIHLPKEGFTQGKAETHVDTLALAGRMVASGWHNEPLWSWIVVDV